MMIWEASGRPDPARPRSAGGRAAAAGQGMCVPPNISKADDAELDEIAEIIRFRREQGWATPVLCQSWGQVAFRRRSPVHEPPAAQDARRYPCIAFTSRCLRKAD